MINFKYITRLGVVIGAFTALSVVPEVVAQSNSSISNGSTRANTSVNSSVSDKVSWTDEDRYWRNNFSSRPYNNNMEYSSVQPAYRYGVNAFSQYGGRSFDQISDAELERNWNSNRGSSNMDWSTARSAVRDSYDRLYNNSRNSGNSSAANRNSSRDMNSTSPSSGRSANTGGTSTGRAIGNTGSSANTVSDAGESSGYGNRANSRSNSGRSGSSSGRSSSSM